MSTTKSQKTEDMLDQTFANFDSEVTGAETQQTQSAKEENNIAAKKSNNMIVFIGAGVAAVGAVAYLFVLKPMLEPAQPTRVVVQAPKPDVVVVPVAVPEPVQVVAPIPVENMALPGTTITTVTTVNPVDPLAQLNPQVAQTQPTEVKVEVPAALVPVAPMAAPKIEAPILPPEVAQVAQVTQVESPKIVSSNTQSVAVVDELKNMFEKQTSEFKTVLTDIDNRVGSLDTAMNEQRDINTKFDQRIAALESNKTVARQPIKVKAVNNSPVVRQKRKSSISREEARVDSSVLVDKSTNVTKVSITKDDRVERASLPQVALHSIYSGRLWVKNSDGSLSTYSSGDRLPSGEVIRSINDEKFEVTTDKRVIRH